MCDLLNKLRKSQEHGNILSGRAADEIERLTACVEHHQAVEADQERAIERLQSERPDWAEYLRLINENQRMRVALERVAKWEPESSEAWMLRSICVEALQEGE